MMTDIFSSLDLGLSTSMTNMMFVILILSMTMMIPILFMSSPFPSSNRWSQTPYMLTSMMLSIMKSLLNKPHTNMYNKTIPTIFIFIMMMNYHSIIPYTTSTTSHLLLTLPLALISWLSLILSDLTNNTKKFLMKLSPSGAPNWLTPFLVLIETLSMCARPITLSFRLAANISTGHIILGLMGIYLSFFALNLNNLILLMIFTKILYIILEFGICLIQAYIFSLLLTMYASEHT